jgi:hypothetical protein
MRRPAWSRHLRSFVPGKLDASIEPFAAVALLGQKLPATGLSRLLG